MNNATKKGFYLFSFVIAFLIIPSIVFAKTYNKDKFFKVVHQSKNLEGYLVFPECMSPENFGCNTCGEGDASIISHDDFGEVISNAQENKIYVNAIAYKKFQYSLPDGQSIPGKVYKYKGKVRLPRIPSPNVHQQENPQAVHMMVQIWNPADSKESLEGAIYWELNPWNKSYELKLYSINRNNELKLIRTGLKVTPDTKWHSFELAIDTCSKRYVYIRFDNKMRYVPYIKLARVKHLDWGNDISINITAESLAAWPDNPCEYVFTWRTQFKDLELSYSSTKDLF